MNDTELSILDYMVSGREAIMDGEALLERVRTGQSDRRHARTVFNHLAKEIRRAREFALTPDFAGCRESLEGLARDLEALREQARTLL